MNNETKNEVRKNVATGASTAAGATVGVVIGAAVTPETAEAAEVEVVASEPTPRPASASTTPQAPQPTPEPTSTPTPTEPEQTPVTPVTTEEKLEVNEVEVLSYDRVTNPDGSQMDVAVINVNGNEVGFLDVNLDGEADRIASDINHNGIIEENEAEVVIGQGIAMEPFANAAGFNEQFAQNDLPDYVNDADVDTYMA